MAIDRLVYWKGRRVQLHPGLDDWMRGDRYGEVVGVTRRDLKVRLDKSRKTRTLPEDRVTEV